MATRLSQVCQKFLSLCRRSMLVGLIIVSIITFILMPQVSTTRAQGNVTVEIDGIVQSINGSIWSVGGVSVEVTASTTITGYPVVGSHVKIIATQDGGGLLIAISISLATPTPTSVLSGTPTLTRTATPTGTLTAPASVTPVGSVTPTGTPIPYVTIIIEGPVEEININIIVVYGMRVRLRTDDPVLVKLKVGDWVRVSGNFEHDKDDQVIIVVVVIVIINAPTVIVVAPGGGNSDGGGKGKGHHGDDD